MQFSTLDSIVFHAIKIKVFVNKFYLHKETELFLIYSFTYNLIKLVSLKVLPSSLNPFGAYRHIYMHSTANLQTLHFKYLLNKYTYWRF